ncbi:D-amino-acid transaminase [Brevibacillus humidisoli]|uniref:D-amino-acid transaminase n=1 Tax=Brevibacillus humidisoli TaxID=2895522 RepID=UPI001E34F7B0|nr:D-amino-acid transaminase [Brevibacillus humidisoli]UFJ42942.1 D-amino-acid transaminase [Brevibacillus humidisoli]
MYYVDGRWVEAAEAYIHPEDRGYQFGDGIYEVFRIYQGKIYQWEAHYTRLARSAKELQIAFPWTSSELQSIAEQLLDKNSITETDDAILYMQVTRGTAPRQHEFPEGLRPILSAFARKKERPRAEMQNGIAAALIPDIRWLRCDIKSLNLLGAAMAKQQAKQQGAFEAILHRDGTVTEGSSSNLFVVKDNVLYTHPANHLILHGITRQIVIALAGTLSLEVREETFDAEFLKQADELFFTGTTVEVMPVVSLDGKPVGSGQVGEVVRKLQEAFEGTIG